MDHTRRMVEILGRLRRERNGAVADSMRVEGRTYRLNYGVSLPTIRSIAHETVCNHEFAKYLYLQDVRELRLAALSLAAPESITDGEMQFWADGIINSEMAEEAAMKLLHRIPDFDRLFYKWLSSGNRMLRYAALMAAARCTGPDIVWAESLPAVIGVDGGDMLVAFGCVALLSALALDEKNRPAIKGIAGSLPQSPAADLVREELEWRIA